MSDMEYLFTEWEKMLEAIQTHEGRNEFIQAQIDKLKTVEFDETDNMGFLTKLDAIDDLKVRSFFNELDTNLRLFTKLEDFRKLVYALDRKAWENLFVLSKRYYGHCLYCRKHDTDNPFEVCPECGEKSGKSDLFLYLTDCIMREKRGDKEISYRM